MMTRLSYIGRNYPVFVFFLPVFFVLHGARENFGFVTLKPALLLTLIYLAAALILLCLSRLLLRSWRQAGLLTFLLFSFYLFFGSLHDWLKTNFPGSILVKYSFILPFTFIFLILVIILIRKKRPILSRASLYLNVLLLLFLLSEVILITEKRFQQGEQVMLPAGLSECNNCPKPDFYLIIADEYAGNRELKELFGFDNREFTQQLSERGFYTIPESFSNYNYTPFSVASALNMDYLKLKDRNRGRTDLLHSYEIIRDNRLLRFLEHHGYKFYNYTYFQFKGQPPRIREQFLPSSTRLITGQTLFSRVNRDLRFHLVTRLRSKKELRKQVYGHLQHNRDLMKLTKDKASEISAVPKFVLTHLMMPHYPYYFDSSGKERLFEELVEGKQVNKLNYIQYLQYSNRLFLELIDHIKRTSRFSPVIVLMGDHGFRHFTEKVDTPYHFLNHVSIHLPQKNYAVFYDSISLVNLFRGVLNTNFGQQLPYLKDSSTYLRD